jgi:NodT family efflux transporter outer membrane factor (OMF) lipoprotein
MMTRNLRWAGPILTGALSACAVGPNYAPPKTPVSAAAPFIGAATPASVISTALPDDRWWQLYRDPVLDGLVADALAANTDIRVAVARLERARAQLRGARSDLLPQTSIAASAAEERTAITQTPPGFGRENGTVDEGISISYEVDLFGRVKRGIEAAHADVGAAQEDADAVRVAVVSDTVRAYVDAAGSAQRLAVARHTVDLLDHSIRITNARFDAGRSDRLDVLRLVALRDQQAALIPTLTADREAALFRLAMLTGRTPQDLPEAARGRTTTPDLTQPIPVGDGRILLARRPDVRAAERRLAADTARIGVATADLYPRISLGGAIGTTSLGASDILGGGPFRWMVGPLISWAFPNNQAIRARIGAAKADGHADLASFDGTVLRALQETETALSAYREAEARKEVLTSARDAAQRTARITLARQREGQIDFLVVLDAQRTLAQTEADLAEATRAVAFAQVDLFRALGGGWQ